tara:strand:+ start:680 stop:1615 length:936 start_codon:yes stop_codon:yes gene_type:complete
MSKGRRKVSKSNPVGKTTGETARRLRALGWNDKEIQQLPPQTKRSYLKYGFKPQPYSLKQRITRTKAIRKPGEATKNKSEYSDRKLALKSRRFDEPAKIDGKKNKNYIPVKEKDKDLSDLRQKRAASKEGGPKLTEQETKYLQKLQRWFQGEGRKTQSQKESIFSPVRRKGGQVIAKTKQELAKAEERAIITEEKEELFKEGIKGDVTESIKGGRSVLDRVSRTEKRRIRSTPGGETAMKKLGIGTEDVPKFSREFRESRGLDRKDERERKQLEEIQLQELKQLEKEEQEQKEEEKEKEEEKPKYYGRYAV